MTLPNNTFGWTVMLVVFLLLAVVPFILVHWLLGMLAPWWVSFPCGIAASALVLIKLVKIN